MLFFQEGEPGLVGERVDYFQFKILEWERREFLADYGVVEFKREEGLERSAMAIGPVG